MSDKTNWLVWTKDIDIVVEAQDQWEAFDALRSHDPSSFGLIVEAQRARDTEESAYAVRTSHLFGRWGEPQIAAAFIHAAIDAGMPDTSADDLFVGPPTE